MASTLETAEPHPEDHDDDEEMEEASPKANGGGDEGTGAEEDDSDDDSMGDDDEEEEDNQESRQAKPKSSVPPSSKSRKRKRRHKLFQDCVTIQIPLDVTADLGIAFRHTRRKRIQAFTKAYPELFKKEPEKSDTTQGPTTDSVKGDNTTMEDEDDDDPNMASFKSPPRKPGSHIPRREDYANVVDYLEAKYTQGVMLDDDQDADADTNGGGTDNDDDDGQGSVYSKDSFLDDQDLHRSVAEQVLAQSTTTKLELESNMDDAFFVNVGDLEVEETFMTAEDFDPLKYVDDAKKPAKKRRKTAEKKDTNGDKKADASVQDKTTKKKAAVTNGKAETAAAAKKKDDAPSKSQEKKAKSGAPKKKAPAVETPAAKAAAEKKKQVDTKFKLILKIVKSMSTTDLPRRKTTVKVTISCPPDKEPGDMILFANPHIKGQRLKVKIPKKTASGGTFTVSVPVGPSPEDEDATTDHNKWSREFYDAFDDYCTLYDEWIDRVAVVKKEAEIEDYLVYMEKRKKYDPLLKDLPKDLKTPLDRAYLVKLLRRARQNRSKRNKKTQQRKEQSVAATQESDEEGEPDEGENEEPAEEKEEAPSTRQVTVPQLSTEFPTVAFDMNQFYEKDS